MLRLRPPPESLYGAFNIAAAAYFADWENTQQRELANGAADLAGKVLPW